MYDFEFWTTALHKVGFKTPFHHISYYKITFHHLIYTVSHLHVATMMVEKFYFLQRCTSLQFHKFESLIYLHAQAEYGSEPGEYYNNTICKS